MPGSIKVGGSQKLIAAPYVKVSNTWRQVAVGYTKVAGTWRQWYAANITDTFDRTNAESLGSVSNGVTSWTDVTGTWGISSNMAVASSGSYPISKVQNPLQTSNYTVTVDTPTGASSGIAFWITDTNNWYAAIGEVSYVTNYSCPSGGSLSGTTCNVTTTYNATYSCSGPYDYVNATQGSYNNGPVTVTTTTLACGKTTCTQCNLSSGTGYQYWCSVPCCYKDTYSCPQGGYVLNYDCYVNYTNPGYCTQGAGPYSNDPDGGSGGFGCYSCSYTCPSGGSLSGATCTASSSYSATATTTWTNSVKIIQNTAGSISTVASYVINTGSSANTPPTVSLKVTTSNSTVIVSAYTGAGQAGTETTNTYTFTSPITTSYAGIISTTIGVALDNFGLK